MCKAPRALKTRPYQEATDSISRLEIAPERELLRDFEYKNIFEPIKTSTSI